MSLQSQPDPGKLNLLRPREVAEMFGVRPTTIARWAREGKISPLLTPGGHRRYDSAEIRKMLAPSEPTVKDSMTADAVRLYEQGWSIRQVADRFGATYGAMRRLLKTHTTLRHRGGASFNSFPIER
jgi:transposase